MIINPDKFQDITLDRKKELYILATFVGKL